MEKVTRKLVKDKKQKNEDLEELPYINDLTTSFCAPPQQEGPPHPFSQGVNLCLASVLVKVFLCVLSHLLLCYVSNKKLYTFTAFASMINAFFH